MFQKTKEWVLRMFPDRYDINFFEIHMHLFTHRFTMEFFPVFFLQCFHYWSSFVVFSPKCPPFLGNYKVEKSYLTLYSYILLSFVSTDYVVVLFVLLHATVCSFLGTGLQSGRLNTLRLAGDEKVRIFYSLKKFPGIMFSLKICISCGNKD